MKRLLLCFAGVAFALAGADWLGWGGDAQRSGWQKGGKSIDVGNAGGLKLLWKLALDDGPRGRYSLTAPTMLGPIITHRGVKELVFIGSSSDTLYAVDADRGRIFWKRQMEGRAGESACGAGLTATPVLAPPPPGTKVRDDDEGATPMRPFYFVAGDGSLHTIRPADGVDMAPAQKFVPAGASVSALNLFGRFVYAGTSAGCGAAVGVWGIDTDDPHASARFFAGANSGVSVGFNGGVYSGSAALTAGTLEENWRLPAAGGRVAPIPLEWEGRELVAAAGEKQLVLLDREKVMARSEVQVRGMASWRDARGERWIYAAAGGRIEAYRVLGMHGSVSLVRGWSSREMVAPIAPAIVNGVVFALDAGGEGKHAVLYALDAHTGKQLYSSRDSVGSFVSSSGLAVANGHICFGTWDGVLYCFGFPIEI